MQKVIRESRLNHKDLKDLKVHPYLRALNGLCGSVGLLLSTSPVPTATETTVTAAKKTVSVAPTMVCKVLAIGFLIVEQSFANPKLVFGGAPARSQLFPARYQTVEEAMSTSMRRAREGPKTPDSGHLCGMR